MRNGIHQKQRAGTGPTLNSLCARSPVGRFEHCSAEGGAGYIFFAFFFAFFAICPSVVSAFCLTPIAKD
jgi:hypothetical protein